jgi:cytosine/adenosine deaminase-related metal-dependent hydrolase
VFGPDVSQAWQSAPREWPFIIHAGEGSDAIAQRELRELQSAGVLTAATVIVHGVAFEEEDLELLRKSGAALIWCPSSNHFTLGRSLSTKAILSLAKVALGTDSAITAASDLLDELAFARKISGLAPEILFEMVTTRAAGVLRLGGGRGRIAPGVFADLIAIPDEGTSPAQALLNSNHSHVELVLAGGRPQLATREIAGRWPGGLHGMEPLSVERCERLVRAPICELLASARAHLTTGIRLSGKLVTQ